MILIPLLVVAASLVPVYTLSPRPEQVTCRCLPSDPCWPSDAEWSLFSSQLSQNILTVRPAAAPCHDPGFNVGTCNNIVQNFHDAIWRANQVGANQFTNAEELQNGTISCIINVSPDTPCQQGNVPVIAVNVTTTEDIQHAVRFAADHNLKLVVKNSGHGSFRSMGSGGLLVWTHYLRNIEFNDTFIIEGDNTTSGTPAVTIQAGVTWGDLYDAAAERNVTVVGGIGAGGSVGAGGGWPQGGGHSILSPYYGLGVDNILQFTVVLANGTHVTANHRTNPDIFWAMRGGGGPSFGIATTLTYRTHPAPPLIASFFVASTNSTSSLTALFTEWHREMPRLADEGWSGFYPFNATLFALTLINQNASFAEANASIEPFFSKAAAIPGMSISVSFNLPYSGFHQWYHENFIDGSLGHGYNYTQNDVVGLPLYIGSRLIPRSLFTDSPEAISETLTKIPNGRGFLVGGGAVASGDPSVVSTTPAWRETLVDMTLSASYNDGAPPDVVEAARLNATRWSGLLRELTPGTGTYLNEPDIDELNWQEAYWGPNYPRLQTIKSEVDSRGLFIVFKGVSSEGWDETVSCKTVT